MRFLAFLLALFLLAQGCCSCDEAPPPRRPGDILRELDAAVAERRYEDAAILFSQSVRERAESSILAGDFFRQRGWQALGGPEGRVEEVTVDGNRARARLHDGDEVILVRERRVWRVADVVVR